jgi:hypothetical protein
MEQWNGIVSRWKRVWRMFTQTPTPESVGVVSVSFRVIGGPDRLLRVSSADPRESLLDMVYPDHVLSPSESKSRVITGHFELCACFHRIPAAKSCAHLTSSGTRNLFRSGWAIW